MAQQALFEAEERLTKKIHQETKKTGDFNTMELELQHLLSDKATVVSLYPFNRKCDFSPDNRLESKK